MREIGAMQEKLAIRIITFYIIRSIGKAAHKKKPKNYGKVRKLHNLQIAFSWLNWSILEDPLTGLLKKVLWTIHNIMILSQMLLLHSL